MGSLLSSEVPPPRPPRKYLLSFPEEDFPEEASKAPEDVEDWYSHFLETLACLPHRNGKSILILEPPDDFVPDSRARPGWARKRLRKAYELLGDGHPRIVRYVEPLESGIGIIVERLEPGPIDWYSIPALTVPLPREMSRNDKLLLCLYYRWSLQVLSAFKFAHSRSVFIRNFCFQLVWLRSDFSLALTGFFAASAPEIEEESRRDGMVIARENLRDDVELHLISPGEFDRRVKEEDYSPWPFSDGEWIIDGSASGDIYECGNENGSVKEDLHYWAVFVKFLMNDVSPDAYAPNHEIPNGFEDARLGTIRADAMNGRYESATEIIQDVKAVAVQMGIKIDGDDEVDIDNRWENVFEVCERRLRFRKQD